MLLISKLFRVLYRSIQSFYNLLRILKLKFLYPGVIIDFKTTIQSNCSIICVKGGQLHIRASDISAGTHIKADAGSIISIDNSYLGRNCVITAKQKVLIHKNCLIAEMVVIRDQDHLISENNDNYKDQQFTAAPIEIMPNVWIASKATVLKGVTIGAHSIVAASAVVTKDIPEFEVWGGVPAKFIKKQK